MIEDKQKASTVINYADSDLRTAVAAAEVAADDGSDDGNDKGVEADTKPKRRPIKYNIYDKINASVSTLNKVIIGLFALILLLIFIGMQTSKGIKVEFDTQGGSAVDTIYVQYLDKLERPTSVKPGYKLKAWARYADGSYAWDFDTEQVESDLLLYAIWEKDIQ